jgi:3-oxoacyl-ACP reductase-like protein
MRTLLLTLLIGLSPWCMAAQIYKWVDAQGVTHFDAQPPPGQPSTTVQTPSSPPVKPAALPGNGALGDQKTIDDKVKKQVADQQTQLKAFCEQARTNLAQLQNNPRLREEVEGELRRLSDAQRQERIAEAQKQIAENCE